VGVTRPLLLLLAGVCASRWACEEAASALTTLTAGEGAVETAACGVVPPDPEEEAANGRGEK
jgi:hypothetical protein